VAGEIEDNGDVAALSGERSTAATAEERGTELAAEGDGSEDVIYALGKSDADGDLAVVGTVGGVKGAGTTVETDFAFELGTQGVFEGGNVELGVGGHAS
jgi:hypothetical protein